MEQVSRHTRIVTKVMEAAYKLDKVDCDKERICYLVTDEEWNQLVAYAQQFSFQECSMPGGNIATMQFAGIEVIKRSAVSASTDEVPK